MNRKSSLRSRSVPLEVESLEERRVLSTASYVTGLYTTLLHRDPQPAEVGGWESLIDLGYESPLRVASAFTGSAEFKTNLIVADYQNLLGRTPGPGEVAGWLAGLETGLSEEQLTSLFLGSSEYYQNHGGTPSGWLDGVYQDELGRAPDAAGDASWLAALDHGLPLQTAAADIAASPEALARVVTAAYQNVLGRAPDPQGLASWTGALANGLAPSQLLANLAGSPEFINAKGGLTSTQPTTAPCPSPNNASTPDSSGGDSGSVDSSAGDTGGQIIDNTSDNTVPATVDYTVPDNTDTSSIDTSDTDNSSADGSDCSTAAPVDYSSGADSSNTDSAGVDDFSNTDTSGF